MGTCMGVLAGFAQAVAELAHVEIGGELIARFCCLLCRLLCLLRCLSGLLCSLLSRLLCALLRGLLACLLRAAPGGSCCQIGGVDRVLFRRVGLLLRCLIRLFLRLLLRRVLLVWWVLWLLARLSLTGLRLLYWLLSRLPLRLLPWCLLCRLLRCLLCRLLASGVLGRLGGLLRSLRCLLYRCLGGRLCVGSPRSVVG